MRVVNRTAISVTASQPYIEWTHTTDADAARGTLTIGRAKPYGSAFLLPEFELEEDVLEWMEDNVSWIFELQLSAWTEDDTTWPAARDLKMFREWFHVEVLSLVVDVAEDEIEGEEL